MSSKVDQMRFLASGQDDPHSVALVWAADRIEALEAELAVCREAIEVCLDVAERLPSDDDGAAAVKRCTLRRLNEAIGKAVPRLMREGRPEGQKMYGLRYLEMRGRIKALEATLERQQLSYEREREIDQAEIERLRAQIADAVLAMRDRCARACDDEARLWEADGNGPATEARLCAARIRSLA
jgi:hypothetical protein